jgi:hypothetical protein
MVTIGDIITITYKPQPFFGIPRCPSTYGFMDLCFKPKKNTEYIVCQGDAESGFLLAERDNHEAPLGFCLLYIDEKPYIRVTQMNHEPEPVEFVEVVGKHTGQIPEVYRYGSYVACYRVDV